MLKMFVDPGVVWAYSLPKKPRKEDGFDNGNKTSKSTTASRFANFNGTVISVFSFGESQEAIKLFNMKKSLHNEKLKLPDYDTNIQPIGKD